MTSEKILENLPYSHPFLFVDELHEVTEHGARGSYTFPEDAFFYTGHFRDFPITPGVILTECMAQIGVVSLGIYLLREESFESRRISMTGSQVEFFLPVFPGERVEVSSEKIYFRFQKLKCRTEMRNGKGKLICRGEISGMLADNQSQII